MRGLPSRLRFLFATLSDRYGNLCKTYYLAVLSVPLFEYQLYGIGLFAVAAGNVHYCFGNAFIEFVAGLYVRFLHAERGEYIYKILYYLINAGPCGLILCRIESVTEGIGYGQKF